MNHAKTNKTALESITYNGKIKTNKTVYGKDHLKISVEGLEGFMRI